MTTLQLTRPPLPSDFWPQKSITEKEHRPYSSDLAPNDFWFYPKIVCLNGTRISDSQRNVTTALKAIPEQQFQKYFQLWKHHWAKCIAAQGEHLEVDPSQ
jgi:hypothetical protein